MQEFVFTSKRFKGSMRFVYEHGLLISFDNKAELTQEQIGFFTRNFPFRSANLTEIQGKGNIIEVTDLSFMVFWNKYDYKVDKVKAEKFWNKMSKEDKVAALAGIYKYKNQCIMKSIPMVYPERYLKYQRWLDEN